MPRSRRSNRRGSRSRGSRRTFWTHSLVQVEGLIYETDGANADYDWLSVWLRFPSGYEDLGASSPMGSDETLVRTISALTVAWTGAAATFETPMNACFGIIAFDGGKKPEFYDLATFDNQASFVAPPHPIVNASDDWILRIPFQFLSDSTYGSVQAETFIQSRAMRKLPPGTGILGVFGALNLLGAATTPTWNFSWDVRMALRSGYTAPASVG